MAGRVCAVVAGTVMVCVATAAWAQEAADALPHDRPGVGSAAPTAGAQASPADQDTRTQYPPFLIGSYFSVGLGFIHSGFSNTQLEPGFRADSIEVPRMAARVGLFGHEFSRHLSAQATYMRPVRYVVYQGVNGDQVRREVPQAFGGLTLASRVPLTRRISLYGEGGLGITSRTGVETEGRTLVGDAHFASALLGAGIQYQTTPAVDFLLGVTYLPGQKAFSQPPTRLFTTGFQYNIRPLSAEQVEGNRGAGFIFPKSLVRVGFTTNTFTYGVNNFLSQTLHVFWGGRVEARRGVTSDYQRNVFHTKRRFAFDLGASASYWTSNGNKEAFRTLSVYPLFRFILLRTRPADLYVNYSLAGPSYISRTEIDGRDTGARFTFQDFVGLGLFLNDARRFNAEIGIKHFSNGNIFTRNASIKIPLTLTLGYAF